MSVPRETPSDVFAVDPLQDKRWHELVQKHPNSSVFHSTEWLSALKLAYGYEPVAYTKCPAKAELVSALVFCKVESWLTGRRFVSLPFSDHCDPLVEGSVEFDELLLPLRKSVDGGRWDYAEMRPICFEPGVASGYGRSDKYCWHTIDLRPRVEHIYQNFHKSSVQRKIRRAEREGLFYEEGNSEQLLGHFYKLLIATRRRQHYPPQPIRWFRSLITTFGPKLKIRMAFDRDIPVAAILTLQHKNTVTYKYGCSDARMHASGSMALLFWTLIQQAKAAGYEKLDLGRSDRSNEGLISFKQHWGGIASNLPYWRYPNRIRPHERRWKKKIAEHIVEAAPNRLLATVGDMLYRHIG